MKKVLVTGGAGFIGSHVVDNLILSGYSVVIIDNLATGKKENLNSKAKFYEENIIDSKRINEIFSKEKPEIVLHMAAQVMLRKSIEEPLMDAQTNILGTISILEACKNNGVKKIIYTSTGGARVGEPEYLPVDEKHPINPCSPYGISKHTAEHYVWMYSKNYGIDYLILCFGNVYGPRDDPKFNRVIPNFINKFLNKEQVTTYGDGSQTRDFIYVEDLAKLIVKSIEKNPSHKLFHLANGKQISVNQIFETIKSVTKINVLQNRLPAIKGEVKDIVLDISLARKELSWDPKTDINEGIKKTVEWFKNKI